MKTILKTLLGLQILFYINTAQAESWDSNTCIAIQDFVQLIKDTDNAGGFKYLSMNDKYIFKKDPSIKSNTTDNNMVHKMIRNRNNINMMRINDKEHCFNKESFKHFKKAFINLNKNFIPFSKEKDIHTIYYKIDDYDNLQRSIIYDNHALLSELTYILKGNNDKNYPYMDFLYTRILILAGKINSHIKKERIKQGLEEDAKKSKKSDNIVNWFSNSK